MTADVALVEEEALGGLNSRQVSQVFVVDMHRM